jgi:hypothetical protein
MRVNAWTDVEKATLVRMWGVGYTASQIADALPGRSRDAVLGRIRRLRESGASIPQRESPIIHAPRPPAPPVEAEKPWRCCCCEPECSALVERGSYCAAHAALYYQPPRLTNS